MAAFESRRAEEMARLIERLGGVPSVSPSMREVPLADNPEAVDFAYHLISGQIDIVMLMTGVGLRHLVAQIERRVPRERFLAALSDITTVARGPKPVAVLKELGIAPDLARARAEHLARGACDDRSARAGGQSDRGRAGIRPAQCQPGRGARSARRAVSHAQGLRLGLSRRHGPLAANVRAIAAGEIDVALFTSAHQVVNLLRMAEQLDLTARLAAAWRAWSWPRSGRRPAKCCASNELPVDLEPEHSEDGAPRSGRRRAWAGAVRAQATSRRARQWRRGRESYRRARRGPWDDGPFMKACRREPVDAHADLADAPGRAATCPSIARCARRPRFSSCARIPQLCAEVMITAVERLGVDAAIIFSDLLPMLEPMGLDLEFAHGEGPVIHNPVREAADVDRLIELEDVESLDFVMETVRLTRAGLPPADPGDRLCRCAVHAGQLCHRRGRQPQLSAHQVADVSRRAAPGTR